jgi:putative hemolysin
MIKNKKEIGEIASPGKDNNRLVGDASTRATKIRLICVAIGILVVILAVKIAPARKSAAIWQESVIGLADIAAFNCSEQGSQCAAVSTNGQVMISHNGGSSWERIIPVTVEEGELINAIAINEKGKVVIGTGVDESRWTSLYQLNATQWTKKTGNYGGIGGYSSNGEAMVGGGGLFYPGNNVWQQIPGCENTTLYAAASSAQEILVVGDHAVVGSYKQKDSGWVVSFLKEVDEKVNSQGSDWNKSKKEVLVSSNQSLGSTSALYAVAIAEISNEGKALVGGSQGRLYRRSSEGWFYQNVGKEKEILAAYLDDQGNEGFIGGRAGIAKGFMLQTADGGTSWQIARLAVNGQFGPIIKIVKATDKVLAVSSNGRIYEYCIQQPGVREQESQ